MMVMNANELVDGDLSVLFPASEETHIAVICAAGSDNKVLSITPAVSDHTGYSRGELIGSNLRMLQGPQTREEDIAKFRYAIANCQSMSIPILNYHKSGKPFMNQIDITPVLSPRGELECFASLQRRLTMPQ